MKTKIINKMKYFNHSFTPYIDIFINNEFTEENQF